ncbi:pilus (MSHA type) biogenesis protein MshL [Sulfurovum sp. bin170]|uniref:pilus (MSHA type) biogenesis protein MshL n=1 Tax=Sulfurovum sp. bin170 TaxID=2695268 RepID=UPI0013E01C6E|nr:pilus (MSHA type) biogenesis protein MshL [Sulfurovum sp. bin170]NEW61174.1 pilus (MSHA type) biogenesis protein MshL [Sulfurovum sp. bin170]
MRFLKKYIKVMIIWSLFFAFGLSPAHANRCATQMFTVTLDSALTYGDVIENIAEECELTLIVKDREAKKRLQENLYIVKLNNASLNEFLDVILTENNIGYELNGNRLKISYLKTQSFNLHYISGGREGTSTTSVNSGGGGEGSSNSGGDSLGITITSTDNFQFWSKISAELALLVNRPEDEYKAPKPIINQEAGMITVTGTPKQLKRVSKYIDDISKQLKRQVLIDVNILSVTFDDSATTGVEWSQIYSLQNMAISTQLSRGGDVPNSKALIADGSLQINDMIKFLKTQGDVRSISNPKVLTLNNQPALISVGNELFYKIQSGSSQSNGGGVATTNNEEVKSVFAGILLDITPEISEDGSITLKINPSISDTLDPVQRDDSGSRNIPPDLSRKQISSVVTIQDGQHVILGGLISSKTGTKVSKVPLLGDLPLLDHLFKREVKIDSVEELVLVIRPHIINREHELSLEDLGYRKLKDEEK